MISCSQRSGTTSIDRQPARASYSMCGSLAFQREVRRALWLAARGGAPQEGLVKVDPRRAQSRDELGLGAEARAEVKQPRRLVELKDRAPLRARELHGPRHDRRQHLVEVEARGHRLADLTQRPQLVDRPGQVLEELHVPDRDRGLRGEGRQKVDRPVAERIDLEPPEDQDSDDAVADQHRRAEHRAVPAELAPGGPAVDGISEHVGDLDDAPLQRDPADERLRTLLYGMALHVLPVLPGTADNEGDPVDVALELVDVAAIGAAQPHGVTYDRLEHRLKRKVRVPHQLEDLAGRRLLVDRLGQFALEPSHAVGISCHRIRSSRHREIPAEHNPGLLAMHRLRPPTPGADVRTPAFPGRKQACSYPWRATGTA